MLAAIERVVKAEAAASGATVPPEITPLDRYAMVQNDPGTTKRIGDALQQHFSADRILEAAPTSLETQDQVWACKCRRRCWWI